MVFLKSDIVMWRLTKSLALITGAARAKGPLKWKRVVIRDV